MTDRKTKLSVNVNKIATLRNSRGGDTPNVLKVSTDLLSFGADGITVHPRPDGRHIRTQDVHDLAGLVLDWNKGTSKHVEFNVEGYPDRRFLDLMREVRPHQCTLVPDAPDVLTSNAGWSVAANVAFLNEVVGTLRSFGSKVSLFIDPFAWNDEETRALRETGAERVELYTERYASSFHAPEHDATLAMYRNVGAALHEQGFGVNAGHDLNSQNLRAFSAALPFLNEVSIGHALISEALYWGLEKTVQVYQAELQNADASDSPA